VRRADCKIPDPLDHEPQPPSEWDRLQRTGESEANLVRRNGGIAQSWICASLGLVVQPNTDRGESNVVMVFDGLLCRRP
jgi:hypothetical protein